GRLELGMKLTVEAVFRDLSDRPIADIAKHRLKEGRLQSLGEIERWHPGAGVGGVERREAGVSISGIGFCVPEFRAEDPMPDAALGDCVCRQCSGPSFLGDEIYSDGTTGRSRTGEVFGAELRTHAPAGRARSAM